MSLTVRPATAGDGLALVVLYQRSAGQGPADPVLLNLRWTQELLSQPASSWFVAETGGEVVALVALLVDGEHQLSKITRMCVRPDLDDPAMVVGSLLTGAMAELRARGSGDVIYTTTRSLTLDQQRLTLGLGYRILGIFPNASGADRLRLNGLTASFADGVLFEKRHARFALHPTIMPFYEIVRRQCALPELQVAEVGRLPADPGDPAPALEIIEAPNFVRHRFRQLQERKFLSVTFYPFAEPNALVTDASQRMEIFLRIMPDMRFATVLGERIEERVSPVDLYRSIAAMLYARGITYIEVINDAADAAGIHFILAAGYLPCAYFPCLKNHGDGRRDYVVFGRSFESPVLSDANVDDIYLEYFRAYHRLHQELTAPPGTRQAQCP